jgi:hypothetical protein
VFDWMFPHWYFVRFAGGGDRRHSGDNDGRCENAGRYRAVSRRFSRLRRRVFSAVLVSMVGGVQLPRLAGLHGRSATEFGLLTLTEAEQVAPGTQAAARAGPL